MIHIGAWPDRSAVSKSLVNVDPDAGDVRSHYDYDQIQPPRQFRCRQKISQLNR
jgi:hypothetical protein